jgi:hypothetical protein
MVSAAAPVLFKVTFCTADVEPNAVAGNLSAVGVTVATGPAAEVPVPVKVMICGPPAVLSSSAIVALSAPTAFKIDGICF